MSRSGYSDDYCENLELYRRAVENATNGKRGQSFFRDLLAALDGMPVKRLISEDLRRDGEVCAIGALGEKRGMELERLDPEEPRQVGKAFDIAPCLAAETVYENDEGTWTAESPEERWVRMRKWVVEQIKEAP